MDVALAEQQHSGKLSSEDRNQQLDCLVDLYQRRQALSSEEKRKIKSYVQDQEAQFAAHPSHAAIALSILIEFEPLTESQLFEFKYALLSLDHSKPIFFVRYIGAEIVADKYPLEKEKE